MKLQESDLNKLFVKYLMSCFLYYKKNEIVLEDKQYDLICKTLAANFDSITHPHKKLVTKADIEAQTGYRIKRYPKITQVCAMEWLRENRDN